NPYILDFKSDTIGLQEFIWSDRRNLSEILNDKAGYFINYFGIGGRNPINYNNFDDKHIGIFRDGVQINDNFFGGFDEENISVSEIQKIEEVSNMSSFLYGINSSGKALNIITKDAFQPTLFSQLRYSQDRYGALFADFSLNVPFSKKFNFIFGINSHFTDGYYQNSDFNVWRGRLKLNFYSSPKLNIKTSFYHTKINRRLNYGLVYNTDDTLKNSNFAEVRDLYTYERFSNYYFDISATANLLNDNNSLTKFIFYTNNQSRIYRNEKSGLDPNFYNHDYHYIQYVVDLKQYFHKYFLGIYNFNFLLGANAYFNLYNFSYPHNNSLELTNDPIFIQKNIYSGYFKIDLNVKNLFLSYSVKEDYVYEKFYAQYGIESKYKIINNPDYDLKLKSGYNSTSYGIKSYFFTDYGIYNYFYEPWTKRYFEIGFEARYKSIYLDAYNFYWSYYPFTPFSLRNGSYSIKYLSKYIDVSLNTTYYNSNNIPLIFLKSDIVYHNFFFNNKLDLRLGLSTKYFPNTMITGAFSMDNGYHPVSNDFFNMDFYVGARIGTANINFTVANIFDKVNYTYGIYPYDARDGFLNTIARFSIVWDFNR
ncbi:MAG: TonB-dependent receptor plug domain-containing protein, partial [Ignavibacteria bacterium]